MALAEGGSGRIVMKGGPRPPRACFWGPAWLSQIRDLLAAFKSVRRVAQHWSQVLVQLWASHLQIGFREPIARAEQRI